MDNHHTSNGDWYDGSYTAVHETDEMKLILKDYQQNFDERCDDCFLDSLLSELYAEGAELERIMKSTKHGR